MQKYMYDFKVFTENVCVSFRLTFSLIVKQNMFNQTEHDCS